MMDYRQENVLLYAVRYALGRQTYAVGEVIETVMEQRDQLSDRVKQAIVQSIESDVVLATDPDTGVCALPDLHRWEALARALLWRSHDTPAAP